MAKGKGVKLSAKKELELDVLCKSLIGKEIEIVDSSNKNQVGKKGILVFESANLFYVDVDNSIKKFLKSGLIIGFNLNGKRFEVRGDALLGTLATRIKKIK